MREKVIKGIFVGGVCVFGGYVVKKLKDIHNEIIYFEREKYISFNKKEHDKRMKDYWKKSNNK